jgi:hypothetical protein
MTDERKGTKLQVDVIEVNRLPIGFITSDDSIYLVPTLGLFPGGRGAPLTHILEHTAEESDFYSEFGEKMDIAVLSNPCPFTFQTVGRISADNIEIADFALVPRELEVFTGNGREDFLFDVGDLSPHGELPNKDFVQLGDERFYLWNNTSGCLLTHLFKNWLKKIMGKEPTAPTTFSSAVALEAGSLFALMDEASGAIFGDGRKTTQFTRSDNIVTSDEAVMELKTSIPFEELKISDELKSVNESFVLLDQWKNKIDLFVDADQRMVWLPETRKYRAEVCLLAKAGSGNLKLKGTDKISPSRMYPEDMAWIAAVYKWLD